jgi:carbon storage regulator
MLVLTRKKGEKIYIGDGVTLKVLQLSSGSVRLGIDAPKEVAVTRAELARPVSRVSRAGKYCERDNRSSPRRHSAGSQGSDQGSPAERPSLSKSTSGHRRTPASR